jgi:hypothetical protein
MIKHAVQVFILALIAVSSLSCSSGPVAITDASLAKGYDQGKTAAVDPTTSFSPTDHIFHLVVNIRNPVSGTKIGAGWTLVEAGTLKDQKLDSKDITLTGGENVVHFTLTNTDDWPVGNYKVDIALNDKPDRTLEFQVK